MVTQVPVGLDVKALQEQFEDASPQDILRWAAETFGHDLAVVTSFQHTGIATLHMLQDIAPDTPVLTLDTGLLFPETLELIDHMEADYNLNLKRLKPDMSVEEQACQYGDKLWERQPDQCCYMRKVVPLNRELKKYKAWVTGLRRDQATSRENTPVIDWDPQRPNMIKLAPFATWTAEMVEIYIKAHELPYNPLYERGYLSIGCWPCTRPANAKEDPRAGRWSNSDKIECGIHLQNVNGADQQG